MKIWCGKVPIISQHGNVSWTVMINPHCRISPIVHRDMETRARRRKRPKYILPHRSSQTITIPGCEGSSGDGVLPSKHYPSLPFLFPKHISFPLSRHANRCPTAVCYGLKCLDLFPLNYPENGRNNTHGHNEVTLKK